MPTQEILELFAETNTKSDRKGGHITIVGHITKWLITFVATLNNLSCSGKKTQNSSEGVLIRQCTFKAVIDAFLSNDKSFT